MGFLDFHIRVVENYISIITSLKINFGANCLNVKEQIKFVESSNTFESSKQKWPRIAYWFKKGLWFRVTKQTMEFYQRKLRKWEIILIKKKIYSIED